MRRLSLSVEVLGMKAPVGGVGEPVPKAELCTNNKTNIKTGFFILNLSLSKLVLYKVLTLHHSNVFSNH